MSLRGGPFDTSASRVDQGSELRDFLEARGLTAGPLTVRRVGEGHSNLTHLVGDGERTVVVRRPPPPPHPPGGFDVLREARVMRALEATAVPVPRVLATAEAGEVVDVPLVVMSFEEGPVITATTPAELGPAGRRRVGESLADALAALHGVDPTAVGLGDLGRVEGSNRRRIERMRRLAGASGADVDADSFAALAERLAAAAPPESGSAILHGDYRIGNVVAAPGAVGRVRAILDWELATLGDPLADLGYLLAAVPSPAGPATAAQRASAAMAEPGWPSATALADRYAERSGRDLGVPGTLGWHVAAAQFRLAALYSFALGRGEDPYYRLEQVEEFLAAAESGVKGLT